MEALARKRERTKRRGRDRTTLEQTTDASTRLRRARPASEPQIPIRVGTGDLRRQDAPNPDGGALPHLPSRSSRKFDDDGGRSRRFLPDSHLETAHRIRKLSSRRPPSERHLHSTTRQG